MTTPSTHYSGENDKKQLLTQLKEKVFLRRPVLKDILTKNGDLSLYEYSKTYYRPPTYPINEERKNEFLEVFKREIASVFGEEIADSCARQVGYSYHLANTEHHGPVGMPRQLNNNLINSLPFLEKPDERFPNNIIIACSNISFNNWTFPRGLTFHTYSNKGLSENQLVFFGHGIDAYPLIDYKPYSNEAIKNMRKTLYTLWNERFVWKKEYKKINQLIDEVFAHPSVINSKSYTEQSSKINLMLWEKMGQTINRPLQRLVYVEQEKIANRLLLECHMTQKTLIHEMLFSSHYLDLITKHFEGIICGFNEKTQYGTFLFWGFPKNKKYRTQLWRRGNMLVSPDESFKVALTPEDITRAIAHHELIPSTLLCFILFSFYYGLRQIGGPNQTTYLTQMKDAYIAMQEEYGDHEGAKLAKDIPTTDLLPGNPPVLGFLEGPKQELIESTPLDLYLYGTPTSADTFLQVSKNITLSDSISRTLPLWYRRCYAENEREEALLSVTDKDIDAITGLKSKFAPYAKIGDKAILSE